MLWIGSTFSFVFPISEKFPEVTTEVEPTMTEVFTHFLEKSCEDNYPVDGTIYKKKNDALSVMLLSLIKTGSSICRNILAFTISFLKLLVLII